MGDRAMNGDAMDHVGILLTGGPFDSQRWRTAYEIGRAALAVGTEVSYFHYLDGVLVPVRSQEFPGTDPNGLYDEMPGEKYEELVELGASVICCGLCVDARGIDPDEDYVSGVEIGLLPDLADMIGDTDRFISL